jgi:serine/threonine protein kinase
LKNAVVAETIFHNAGVNHRDICPRNILIQGSNYDDDDTPLCDIDMDVKIIDFDIAEAIPHPRSADRIYKSKSSEHRKDIWPAKMPSPIGTY